MASPGTLSDAPPATGLLSLPKELISLITLFADKSTAIALTRVSPHFSSIDIDQHLWEGLDLLDIQHVPTNTRERYYQASADIGQRSAARIQAILERADTRRGGMIRSIEVTPHVEALDGLMQLLRVASPTLETLEFHPPEYPPWTDITKRPDVNDQFESKLFQAGLTLPSLRTLTVGQFLSVYHNDTPGIALYLCGIAPGLEELVIHFLDKPFDYGPDHRYLPPYPLPRQYPNVSNLFLLVARDGGDRGQAFRDLTDVLPSLPNVRRLTINYSFASVEPSSVGSDDADCADEGPDPDLEMSLFLSELGRLNYLEDLDWRTVEPEAFWGACKPGSGFESLRRLVLGPVDWDATFIVMPPMPNLQMICFTGISNRTITCFDECIPYVASGMESNFASMLRNSPKLRFLHVSDDLDDFDDCTGAFDFDSFENLVFRQGCSNGEILSVRHNGEEALYLDLAIAPSPLGGAILTDYQGKVVPVGILEIMQTVAGLEDDDWQGRGIEVGEEAWAVLARWYEMETAEEAEGGQ